MNLTAILAECYRRLRYNAAPPAAVTTALTSLINEVHYDLLTMPELERLRDDVIPITALANQSRTGLPPSIVRVKAIVDRTNNHKLQQVPLAELRLIDPAKAFVGGYPLRYSVIGNVAVQIQPAAATGLWVASSAAGDTTQNAFVETIVTGGYPNNIITAGTLLTGTARVQIGTLATHIEVTRFYLDAACAGSISLYDAAVAGNELARIPIGKTFSRYLAVEWWPVQSADVIDYADVTRGVYDLVKGTDEPLIPFDFHDLLVQGVMYREYVRLDDSRLALANAAYEKGKQQLVDWVMNDGDRIASLRQIPSAWNRLGANYPAEHWPPN